jgi:hypothetical protein
VTGRAETRLPWRDGDVVMVSATALAGLVASTAGWFGSGGAAYVARQAIWLNLAVVGFVIFAIGNVLWLMRLRRAVTDRRVSLVALDPMDVAMTDDSAGVSHQPVTVAGTSVPQAVRVPGMSRVHHPDCPLVAGKQLEAVGFGAGEPCGVCWS